MMESTQELTRSDFNKYLERFTGINNYGDAKAVGSYQLFAAEDDENSKDRQTIYKISKASYSLRHDKTHPEFIALDIRFNSYSDSELKLVWSRLKRFEDNMRKEPDKTWIIHFTLLDTGSLSDETDKDDILLMAHLVNPVMSYITRENPTDLAEERLVNGEKLGGNIVRLLFTANYVSLEQTGEYKTSAIKGDILREREASEYLDNYIPPMTDDL